MTRPRPVIAIDGPAGAGKSTVAQALAARLGYVLVDTGALYRGLALLARERGIAWSDGAALGAFAASIEFRFVAMPQTPNTAPHLFAGERDLSDDIRTPEISMGASDVSKHPEVRAALLDIQRQLGREGGVVLEGRDIGTVVFPDAEAKIFLTAGAEVRARRRVRDLEGRGIQADFGQTLAEIQARDAQDAGRSVAPLRAAEDAVILDTTALDIPAVVEEMARIAQAKGA
jgi:cytidylate kinase